MASDNLNPKPKSEIYIIIKNTLILFAITVVAGLLLSLVHSVTAAPIAAQKIIQRDTALNTVLPDSQFEELEVQDKEKYPNIVAVFAAKDQQGNAKGYAFMLTGKGYGGAITLVAGFDADRQISGIDIVSHSETPGLGANADNDKFKQTFVGKKVEPLHIAKGSSQGQDIDAISGATITSVAVVGAVNEAIAYYNAHLEGGK